MFQEWYFKAHEVCKAAVHVTLSSLTTMFFSNSTFEVDDDPLPD